MVARGNNRNNGTNLGAVTLNANNALSNSNGNNWRSRLSNPQGQHNHTTVERQEESFDRLNLKHHTQRTARRKATAVKDAHKHAVSRTRKGLEGREG